MNILTNRVRFIHVVNNQYIALSLFILIERTVVSGNKLLKELIMRHLTIFTAMLFSAIIWSCGDGANTKTKKDEVSRDKVAEEVKEESFPDGYPQEITLPEGFTPGQIKTGNGTRTNAEGTITYKTFMLEKMMPENRAGIITHYRKITEEQQWEGEWRISDEGLTGSGTFIKDNLELEIKVTDMLFKSTLRILQLK